MTGAPLVKLAGLWEHVSASGNQYYVGRLGAAKIVILKNRDRQGDQDPSHILFVTEPAGRARTAPEPAPRRRSAPRRQRQYHDLAAPVAADQPLSDRVDDLWSDGA